MFRNVFMKTLKDQQRGLIGWGISIVLTVLLTASIWPSMKDMPDLDRLLAQYPDAMKELFNVDAMATGAGYLNAELFSLTVPVILLIYAIARGVRLTAAEEEAGTFETLLGMPLSRTSVLLQKAAALAVSVCALGIVLFASTTAVASALGMGVAIGDIASASISMSLLAVEFGFVAIAIGAATGKRGLALAATGAFAVAGYMFYAVGAFVDALEPWRVLSPFYQATEGGPIGAGLQVMYLWMPLVGIAAVAVAVRSFERRDILI